MGWKKGGHETIPNWIPKTMVTHKMHISPLLTHHDDDYGGQTYDDGKLCYSNTQH